MQAVLVLAAILGAPLHVVPRPSDVLLERSDEDGRREQPERDVYVAHQPPREPLDDDPPEERPHHPREAPYGTEHALNARVKALGSAKPRSGPLSAILPNTGQHRRLIILDSV